MPNKETIPQEIHRRTDCDRLMVSGFVGLYRFKLHDKERSAPLRSCSDLPLFHRQLKEKVQNHENHINKYSLLKMKSIKPGELSTPTTNWLLNDDTNISSFSD